MFVKTAIVLAFAALTASHSTFQSFVINGKHQAQHFAVRTPAKGNRPVFNLTSTAMICNDGAPTSDQVEVSSGSTIGMQWWHDDAKVADDGDYPIARGHRGPILVYIANATTNGEGTVWQKIWEDGLSDDGTWAVDTFFENEGVVSVQLPPLRAGEYLIRSEIIALHQAAEEGRAQFFIGCGQLKVTGNGTLSLPDEGVDMREAYQTTDPGILFDLDAGETEYIIPGPSVWDYSSYNNASFPSVSAPSATSSTAETFVSCEFEAPLATTSVPSSPTFSSQSVASFATISVPSSPTFPSQSVAKEATISAPSSPTSSSQSVASFATTIVSSSPTSSTPASAVDEAEPSTTVAAAIPPSSIACDSDCSLPESFPAEQFLSWLRAAFSRAGIKSRRHARALSL